jgi:hypothetical protein
LLNLSSPSSNSTSTSVWLPPLDHPAALPSSGPFQNTQPPPLFPSIFFASSAFQNPENFEKLEISQAISPLGLVEEGEDESGDVEDTIGQVEDESDEVQDTIEEIDDENDEDEQDVLKVGLDLNQDMKNVKPAETAPLMHNMDMDLDTGASAALGGLKVNKKMVEEQNPDVEDHGDDVDATLMNLELVEMLDQQLMAPTAGRGCTIPSNRKLEYPEMQQNINHNANSGDERSTTMIVDETSGPQQCEEESLLELDQRHIGYMAAAGIGHVEAASEEVSGSAGVPTRTSPAAPPLSLSHAPPQKMNQF